MAVVRRSLSPRGSVFARPVSMPISVSVSKDLFGCGAAALHCMVHVEVLPFAEPTGRANADRAEPRDDGLYRCGMAEVVDDVGRSDCLSVYDVDAVAALE